MNKKILLFLFLFSCSAKRTGQSNLSAVENSATIVATLSGQLVTVHASGGPANTNKNWVGLYRVGANAADFIDWKWLNNSQVEPGFSLSSGVLTFTFPVSPGEYEFRFLPDDKFAPVLATSSSLLQIEGASSSSSSVSSSSSQSSGIVIEAASARLSDIQSAIALVQANGARNGTVIVPDDEVEWSGTLELTRGITLKSKNGRNKTKISSANLFLTIRPDATALENEEIIRVEGFTFNGKSAGGNSRYYIFVTGSSSTKAFKNLAIGKNKFENAGFGSTVIYLKDFQVRGAVYENIFDGCDMPIRIFGLNNISEWVGGKFPFRFGNDDNLFFENNEIKWSQPYDGSSPGWIEIGQGGRIVVRYNTWDYFDKSLLRPVTSYGIVTWPEVFDAHGFQNWGSDNPQTGTMTTEFYGNKIENFSGNKWLAHRGSWGMYHNNLFTGSGAMFQTIQQYAGLGQAWDSGCQEVVEAQQPTASTINTEVNNTYGFNNTKNGNQIAWGEQWPGACGIRENHEWWGYKSNFDGSVGIGTGTNLPTGICTEGVGFWLSPSPGPTVISSTVQVGDFYKCEFNSVLNRNSYKKYYEPFTYPHPLRL